MKKLAITLFGISVFAGLGYVAFANTPIGKNTLIKWLLKKWSEAAKKQKKELNKEDLKVAFQKLEYNDLELVVAYTWLKLGLLDTQGNITSQKRAKRTRKMALKMKEKKITERAGLAPFENIVFPG